MGSVAKKRDIWQNISKRLQFYSVKGIILLTKKFLIGENEQMARIMLNETSLFASNLIGVFFTYSPPLPL